MIASHAWSYDGSKLDKITTRSTFKIHKNWYLNLPHMPSPNKTLASFKEKSQTELWLEGGMAQWIAYLLPDPSYPVPVKFLKENLMLLRLIDNWYLKLEYRLNKVNWINQVQASGKLVQ